MDVLVNKAAMDFMKKFEALFKSAPHLPKGIVDFFVSIAAWLAGLGGVLSIYGGITGLFFSKRLGWARTLTAFSGINPAYFILVGVISILSGLLLLMAFNPLKEKKFKGWMYIFWVSILNLVQGLVGIFMGIGGLVGVLIGSAIGFYLIFEMKKSYR